MRFRPLVVSLVALLSFLPVTSFAAGNQQPPPTTGEYCSECSIDPTTYGVSCEPMASAEFEDPLWADCVGGYLCFNMPDAGWWCMPNCGERCLWV